MSLASVLAAVAALFLAASSNPASGLEGSGARQAGQSRQTQIPPPSAAPGLGANTLSDSDKSEAAATFALKSDLGDKVWPGFAAAAIPILLYDTRFEFLLGSAGASAPWVKVGEDVLEGRPYFRRPAADPQAFAVKVDSVWAGSVATLDTMNAKGPFKLSPDIHLVIILHEMFHAFEADQAPKRFAAALQSYKAEAGYPYDDKDFAAAWAAEGAALAGALKASDDLEATVQARKFIEIRDARRSKALLDVPQLDYERQLEWLEGLAEYAEITFYKLAAGRPGPVPGTTFGTKLPWLLQYDFARLQNQLGTQKGDLRFYVSGMAQAFLLDRLDPDWKDQAALSSLLLEDLIRQAVLTPEDRRPGDR